MTGCSAPNCNSSTRKGMRFARFPSDPERRRKWVINCRRARWSPTPSNRLCHLHFEESQFENARKDGWRKLKPTAVPTIFNFTATQPDNAPRLMGSHRGTGFRKIVASDFELAASSRTWSSRYIHSPSGTSPRVGMKKPPNLVILSRSYSSPHTHNKTPQKGGMQPSSCNLLDCNDINVPNITSEEDISGPESCTIEKLKNKIDDYRKEISQLKQKLREQSVRHLMFRRRLYRIFHTDQLSALENSSFRRRRWRSSTLRKCWQIRCATGAFGYEYLRKLGYPFPSSRMLQLDLDQNIWTRTTDARNIGPW